MVHGFKRILGFSPYSFRLSTYTFAMFSIALGDIVMQYTEDDCTKKSLFLQSPTRRDVTRAQCVERVHLKKRIEEHICAVRIIAQESDSRNEIEIEATSANINFL
jgi:hypothetical protein